MTYEMDIETLSFIRRKYERLAQKPSPDNFDYAHELEAIDDAISAIKTLQDMGGYINELLRHNHKGE